MHKDVCTVLYWIILKVITRHMVKVYQGELTPFALGVQVVNMVRKRRILVAGTLAEFIFLACLLVGQVNAETTHDDIPV